MSERARLVVESGTDAGRSFALAPRATLGRGEECDVRLLERSVSRVHARIERTQAGWQVVDLGSTNGVFQDGQRVERAALRDGDRLRLGEVRVRFRLEREEARVPTGTLRSVAARQAVAARARRAPGRWSSDLGQRPAAVQAALLFGALIAGALLSWGVFAAVQTLRGSF